MKTINKVTIEKLSSMTTDLLQMPKKIVGVGLHGLFNISMRISPVKVPR